MTEWLMAIHADKILAGIVGIVALYFSVETMQDIRKTKKLIAEGKLRPVSASNSSESATSNHPVLVIDDCYLTENSKPYIRLHNMRNI